MTYKQELASSNYDIAQARAWAHIKRYLSEGKRILAINESVCDEYRRKYRIEIEYDGND